VLEVAREVFAEQGLAAEIRDIAERAGVGVATVYRGFGSKAGLLDATIEQADALISEHYRRAESLDDPAQSLHAVISGLLGFAQSYGWLIQASLAEDDDQRRRYALDGAKERRERLQRIIERGKASGVFRRDASNQVVGLLIEGAVVALTLRIRGQQPHPEPKLIADNILMALRADTG
jgi:AcrR family transcriptional regulator